MKDIKDYLHLYLRCECTVEWKPFMNRNDSRHLIDGWVLQMSHNATESIKPILRPLSDMTEEEGLKVLMLQTSYPVIFERVEGRYMYYRLNYGLRRSKQKNNPFPVSPNSPEATRYLLSKGFDLFNLIPDGLAIDKTKLSNQ